MRILVAHSEQSFICRWQRVIAGAGHAVDLATSIDQLAEGLVVLDFDAMLVSSDLLLGVLSNARGLRQHCGNAAVLVLARGETSSEDAVHWLDRGADDFAGESIEPDELLARVHALLRRVGSDVVNESVLNNLRLDRTARRAAVQDQTVILTARELALLEHLMLNAGRVRTRSELAEGCWDDSYTASSNVIDVLIARLRRKLRDAGAQVRLESVRGVGYVLKPADRSVRAA